MLILRFSARTTLPEAEQAIRQSMPIKCEDQDGRIHGATLVPLEVGLSRAIYRVDWLGQVTDLHMQLDREGSAQTRFQLYTMIDEDLLQSVAIYTWVVQDFRLASELLANLQRHHFWSSWMPGKPKRNRRARTAWYDQVFKQIKDANPPFSQAQVATKARQALGDKNITAKTVENAYRDNGWPWLRADRIG